MTRVLVADSGIGGLSILREIHRLYPTLDCHYLADQAGFPYGHWDAEALTAHFVDLIRATLAQAPADAVVVACNTASTLVLPALRDALTIPVVGTVPAIKPAAHLTQTGIISVLATPGTVQRDYTHALIAEHAPDAEVHLVGATQLAELAEAYMADADLPRDAIASEIRACFQKHGERRTDVVVLGCTHYPFLQDQFEELAPWPVTWLDPAPAIAKQLARVLDQHMSGTAQLTFTTTDASQDISGLAKKVLGLS